MTQRSTIRPGSVVHDDRGQVAQLHGVGVQLIGDRYWAWGEDKRAGSTFTAVAAYSTADFATWVYEGDVLTADASHPELNPSAIVERPKVLFDEARDRYVMYFHLDSPDYSVAQVGVAVGDGPAGPFTFIRSERPLGNLSRDIGVYVEEGIGYLLSEDRDDGLHIYRLTADLLEIDSLVSTTRTVRGDHGYESPALVKHDGLYYLFGSDLTGWRTNDNKYATSADLAGPWSEWRDFAPPGSSTFDSQVSVVVPVRGARPGQMVFIGDRWRKDDLFNSPLIVLPLVLEAGSARLEWRESWSLADLANDTF